jgi:2-polyprenyl-6-methoxyphenol hydroxylase-like FAD-dependent oxidoreductase
MNKSMQDATKRSRDDSVSAASEKYLDHVHPPSEMRTFTFGQRSLSVWVAKTRTRPSKGADLHEGAILRNDVYYLEPLRRWSEGRVVLVGEAAHATTPGVGQGAAQAIDDAVGSPTGSRLAATSRTTLGEYEMIRRPRAEAVLRMSRRVDRAAQLAGPFGWRLRNAVVRWLPERARRSQLEPLIRCDL